MVINPVLKTLIYEDIFSFPLYKNEIWNFLISDKKITQEKFDLFLNDPKIYFDKKTNLYGLSKDKNFYETRIVKKNKSFKNENILNQAILILSKIPTIEMIGISGSMAQFSGNESDDIDLFLLVKKDSVWATRFFAVILLKINKLYRSDKNYKNRICLNMITDHFLLSTDRQDLYTAFEVAQLRPILSRGGSYEKFIITNNWIHKFLPNFSEKINSTKIKPYKFSKKIEFLFKFLFIFQFEKLARIVQMLYMKKRTNETVNLHLLAFHPHDFRREITQKYNSSSGSTRGH